MLFSDVQFEKLRDLDPNFKVSDNAIVHRTMHDNNGNYYHVRFNTTDSPERIDVNNFFTAREAFCSHILAFMIGDNAVVKNHLIIDSDNRLHQIAKHIETFRDSHRAVPSNRQAQNFADIIISSMLIGDRDGYNNLNNICYEDEGTKRVFRKLDFEFNFFYKTISAPGPLKSDPEGDPNANDINTENSKDWFNHVKDYNKVKEYVSLSSSRRYADWALPERSHYDALKKLSSINIEELKVFIKNCKIEIKDFFEKNQNNSIGEASGAIPMLLRIETEFKEIEQGLLARLYCLKNKLPSLPEPIIKVDLNGPRFG